MKDFKDMTEEEITKIVMDSIREEYEKVSDDDIRKTRQIEGGILVGHFSDEYVQFLEGLLVAAFVEKAEAARIQGIL